MADDLGETPAGAAVTANDLGETPAGAKEEAAKVATLLEEETPYPECRCFCVKEAEETPISLSAEACTRH